jgi:hypothetical protein
VATLAFDERGHGSSIASRSGPVVIDTPEGLTPEAFGAAFVSSVGKVGFSRIDNDILQMTSGGAAQNFIDRPPGFASTPRSRQQDAGLRPASRCIPSELLHFGRLAGGTGAPGAGSAQAGGTGVECVVGLNQLATGIDQDPDGWAAAAPTAISTLTSVATVAAIAALALGPKARPARSARSTFASG